MLVAITREVSPAIGDCELTHLERSSIDVEVARDQHDAYTATLAGLGCRIEQLPAEPDLPDSVFVEDVAVVLDEVAIITRPGAESRRGERPTIEQALLPYRPLEHIEAPATIDGGDVLVAGREVWIGLTSRSDHHAIKQFRRAVTRYGYRVHAAEVTGCLHLKSAVTAVDAETLLVDPTRVDVDQFSGRRCLTIDPSEPGAANVVRVSDAVITAAAYPRTAQCLVDTGYEVHTVDASELARAEGALTCCSLLFEDHGT